MNKGFTLVELLSVIVIIGLISGIVVVGYSKHFSNVEEKYYDVLEENILLAGSDYYKDHRDILPGGDDVSEISLGDLVDSKYLEPVRDSKGNTCTEGKIYAYRKNGRYMYEVCLECDNYQSDENKCKKFESQK